jgi:hypothetical protein
MSMWYLLIVVFQGGVDHVSFTDEASCKAAREPLIEETKTAMNVDRVAAVCVPKFIGQAE